MVSEPAMTPRRLWDGPAPGSETWMHDEQPVHVSWGGSGERVRNVVVPTLTPYGAVSPTTRAVLVCPGGGLHLLAMEGEGWDVASLLRDRGVAAFVLKYRLVPTPADDRAFELALSDAFRNGLEDAIAPVLPLAAADAARAVDVIRADGYDHVTILGFSAGARVACELVLRGAAAVDAAALMYLPSVRDCEPGPGAPPVFIAAAADDPLGIDGSLDVHAAWRRAGRPVELHLFEQGGHGFGLPKSGLPYDWWPELFLAWLGAHES